MFDVTRGVVRVRKWPSKRGTPKSFYQRAWNDWFAQVNRMTKTMEPNLWWLASAWSKFNGLYPRDIVLKWTAGTLFDIVLEDGNRLTYRKLFIEDVMFQGARLQRSTNVGISANVVFPIAWDIVALDTAGMWSSGAPTRLTIPAKVQVVEFLGGEYFVASSSGAGALYVRKNGTTIIAWMVTQFTTTRGLTLSTGPVSVAQGDYFELVHQHSQSGTLQADPRTYFAATILQAG